MTTRRYRPWPTGEWKRHLAKVVAERDELLALLGLDGRHAASTADVAQRFPLRVPRGFVARMRREDPDDPLLRQVLPVGAEDVVGGGYSADPVLELSIPPSNGVLSKYHGRALMIVTGGCGIHCRYCFRRHFPYADLGLSGGDLEAAVARIAADPNITEVILSGGDPLMLDQRRLASITDALQRLPDLRRIRLHTRLPIVLPERVDEDLVGWIRALRLPLVVVVHVNHANEIDDDVLRALAVLDREGAMLLNQSVLLEGVNDSAAALIELSERLFDGGVLPYYLHLLDRVVGAAHFEVSDEVARRLIGEMRARLPGFLVPRLVREVAGAPSKIAVDVLG